MAQADQHRAPASIQCDRLAARGRATCYPAPLGRLHPEEGLLARIQLFLSSVSTEFESYREVLRHILNLP